MTLMILVAFLNQMNVFESNECIFQKLESSLEVKRAKGKFSDNHRHNILEFDNALIYTQLTTSKMKRDIYYSNLGIRVA